MFSCPPHFLIIECAQNSKPNRRTSWIIIVCCEIFSVNDKCNRPQQSRFLSSVNLIYSGPFFSFPTISMNNSEEAIFCLVVNEKFACSWLNFLSYWRGTKADNPKSTYICVWNAFWHFLWKKRGRWYRNSQYFIQKIWGHMCRTRFSRSQKLPSCLVLHTPPIWPAFLRTPLGVREAIYWNKKGTKRDWCWRCAVCFNLGLFPLKGSALLFLSTRERIFCSCQQTS